MIFSISTQGRCLTAPQRLTLADGDPYDDIPVLLRLMCSCESTQGNFDRVVDDAAAALRRRRSEVTSLIVDRIDEHVGLVDDLRFLAVREDSQALHDLTRSRVMGLSEYAAAVRTCRKA